MLAVFPPWQGPGQMFRPPDAISKERASQPWERTGAFQKAERSPRLLRRQTMPRCPQRNPRPLEWKRMQGLLRKATLCKETLPQGAARLPATGWERSRMPRLGRRTLRPAVAAGHVQTPQDVARPLGCAARRAWTPGQASLLQEKAVGLKPGLSGRANRQKIVLLSTRQKRNIRTWPEKGAPGNARPQSSSPGAPGPTGTPSLRGLGSHTW